MERSRCKILMSYPTRGRHGICIRSVADLLQKISGEYNYSVILSIDQDDNDLYNKAFLTDLYGIINNRTKIIVNSNVGKVKSYTRDIEDEEFDVCILVKDGVEFVRDFDKVIVSEYLDNLDVWSKGNYPLLFKSINQFDGKHDFLMTFKRTFLCSNNDSLFNDRLHSNYYMEDFMMNNRFTLSECSIHALKSIKWLYGEPDELAVRNIKDWSHDLKVIEDARNSFDK